MEVTPCDSTISVILSDSVSITRWRASVIHVKCDRNFWALLADSLLAKARLRRVLHDITGSPVSHTCCNLVLWLVSAKFSHQSGLRSDNSVSGRAREGPKGSPAPNKARTPPPTGSKRGRTCPWLAVHSRTQVLQLSQNTNSILGLHTRPDGQW